MSSKEGKCQVILDKSEDAPDAKDSINAKVNLCPSLSCFSLKGISLSICFSLAKAKLCLYVSLKGKTLSVSLQDKSLSLCLSLQGKSLSLSVRLSHRQIFVRLFQRLIFIRLSLEGKSPSKVNLLPSVLPAVLTFLLISLYFSVSNSHLFNFSLSLS